MSCLQSPRQGGHEIVFVLELLFTQDLLTQLLDIFLNSAGLRHMTRKMELM